MRVLNDADSRIQTICGSFTSHLIVESISDWRFFFCCCCCNGYNLFHHILDSWRALREIVWQKLDYYGAGIWFVVSLRATTTAMQTRRFVFESGRLQLMPEQWPISATTQNNKKRVVRPGLWQMYIVQSFIEFLMHAKGPQHDNNPKWLQPGETVEYLGECVWTDPTEHCDYLSTEHIYVLCMAHITCVSIFGMH